MKTKFSLIVVAMLLLVSCSQEETVNELDNPLATSLETSELGFFGSKFECIPGYEFPVYNPQTDWLFNITWTIVYDSSLTPEEIYCARYEYFTQHNIAVKMCLLQPTDPNIECWKLVPGWPSQTTSTTIDDDPRLTIDNNSGG